MGEANYILSGIGTAFMYVRGGDAHGIHDVYVRAKEEWALGSHIRKHIELLDTVQRHATRMVPELRGIKPSNYRQ